jgi:hypothetical protein
MNVKFNASEYADMLEFGPNHVFVAEYMERQWEEDSDWGDGDCYDYSTDV